MCCTIIYLTDGHFPGIELLTSFVPRLFTLALEYDHETYSRQFERIPLPGFMLYADWLTKSKTSDARHIEVSAPHSYTQDE